MLELIAPSPELESEFLDYIAEWKNAGEEIIPASSDPLDGDYKTWLTATKNIQSQSTCPPHLVTADTYFLVDQPGKILGAINIRHKLNDYLAKFGGHIGYGIRPTERRKGYATEMLKLALEKCRARDLHEVLITCDRENTASAHTIIANGGILENEIPAENRITSRYLIKL